MHVDLTGYRGDTPVTHPVQRSLILKTFPGFADLGGTELAVMASITHERFFRKGETMLTPGQPVGAMYLIVEGEAQVYRHGKPWERFGPRSTIGGLSALNRDPEGAHAVATRDVLALAIDPDDMAEVFEDNFAITVGVLGALARTLRDAQRMVGGGRAAGGRDYPDFDSERPLTLMDKMFFLARSTSFSGAGIDALAELADSAVELRFSAGERLWKEGDYANHAVIIVSGEAEARPTGMDPFTFRSGWVVGALDSVGRQPRWYSLTSLTDLEVLRLSRAELLDVLEDHPDLAMELLRTFARGIENIQSRLARRGEGEAAGARP